MHSSLTHRLVALFPLLFLLIDIAVGQPQPGYEKMLVFSGLLPDKTQLVVHLSVKGERAASGSITFVPKGDYTKSKEMGLYLLGKGSPLPQWRGIKLSTEPPKDTTPKEIFYLLQDGQRLYLCDNAGHIITVLDWQYEGPVDGRGTACVTCLEKNEAFQAFQKYFVN